MVVVRRINEVERIYGVEVVEVMCNKGRDRADI